MGLTLTFLLLQTTHPVFVFLCGRRGAVTGSMFLVIGRLRRATTGGSIE